MASEVLNSNLGKRAAGSVGPKIGSTGRVEESQAPMPARTEQYHSLFDVAIDDESARAKGGSTLVHRCGTNHWITDTVLLVELNATSVGTTVSSPGLNLVKKVTVRHGENVQEFDYRVVMHYALSKMDLAQQQQILSSAGDTSGGPQSIVVPLPVWWSPMGQGGFKRNNAGLPTFLLSSPVEIEIELYPDDQLLAPGGGYAANAYDTFKVCHQLRKSTTEVYRQFRDAPWAFDCIDYQTVVNFTIDPGSSFRADLTNFDGSSAALYALPVASTALSANQPYSATSDIDRSEGFINSSSYQQLTSNVGVSSRNLMEYFAAGSYGTARGAPLAYFGFPCPSLPFGGSIESAADAEADETSPKYEGSMNLRDASRLEWELRNNGADPVTVDYLNVRYARFEVVDGDLRRVK